MVLYICLFQNIMFAFMPEDDFGIKLKDSWQETKKIEMFFLTLCLLFIRYLSHRDYLCFKFFSVYL